MSKSFKNKLISGLLTLAMVFSMVPTNIFSISLSYFQQTEGAGNAGSLFCLQVKIPEK